MNTHNRALALFSSLCLLAAGCQSTPQGGSPDFSAEQKHLSEAMKDYQVPSKSVPPFATSEGVIDLAMNKLATVAALKGWTFDGSRAREGVVIVSQPGHGKPMLVGIIFFVRDRVIGSLDMTAYTPDDAVDCLKMRDTLMNVIQQ